jgi:hypothetical protein
VKSIHPNCLIYDVVYPENGQGSPGGELFSGQFGGKERKLLFLRVMFSTLDFP